MTTWTETQETINRKMVIHSGPISFMLSHDRETGDRWQYFTISFGQFTKASMDECGFTWPREAIDRARAELDRFEEAELNAELY